MSELVSAARELHARGFHVFPCDHPDQQQCIGKHETCDLQRGKHPAVSWGTWAQTVTAQMIDLVWTKHGGQANPAVSCGPSNLVILDEDEAGALDEWCTTHGITLPATYIVTTGRGRHLYFRWDHDAQPIGNSPKAFGGRKIDVRGHGGYAIAEGARHASGATYTGNGLPVADLPAEVAEMLIAANNGGSATDESASASERFLAVDRADPVPTRIEMGQRHNALIGYAGRLRKSGLDYDEVLPAFRDRWLLCVQPAGQIADAAHHDPECPYPVTWEEAQAKLRYFYQNRPAGQDLDAEKTTSSSSSTSSTDLGASEGNPFNVISADEIETTIPTWAWEYDGRGRILNGALTIFAGRPQAGKSTTARWFAACLTKGTLPGCFLGKPINVAYVATEEAWNYMIAPSLQAAGADLSRIKIIRKGEEPARISSLEHENWVLEKLREVDARAVIIDPLMGTVPGGVRINQNNAVREYIDPWQRIAEKIDGVVIGLAHLIKVSHGGDVLASITGSSAFGEVTRCAFGFAPDLDADDGARVMSQVKNNAGICDLHLAYRIGEKPVTTTDGKSAPMGRFELVGASDKTVQDLLLAQRSAESQSGTDQCARWLKGYLTEYGEGLKGTVISEALEYDFTAKMLRTAREKLNVQTRRTREKPSQTFWFLPTKPAI